MHSILEFASDIDGVQPDRLMIGLARLLAVVTRPLTDALLGCLPFDLSHRQQASRFKKSPVGRT
jgi:hypothetical protein